MHLVLFSKILANVHCPRKCHHAHRNVYKIPNAQQWEEFAVRIYVRFLIKIGIVVIVIDFELKCR